MTDITDLPWGQIFLDLQFLFLSYFIAINSVYLALNYISVFSIIRYMRDHRAEYLPKSLSSYQPPISILIPAYNEKRSIVSSIHSLLQLDYPEFEIVVINDGSTDTTLRDVIKEFAMVEFPEAYRKRLRTEPVKAVYASTRYPQVRMVDKTNGGKSDALNAGINCVRYPLFCVVDADSILQPYSLSRVVRPFLEDSTTVASGGVVRVLNGCTVKNGFLEKIELPKKFLPLFQNVEYLRAFLFGRMGWSPMNALLIISGAFGVFYKERVMAIGGYRTETVGEDMDLVVRLHRNMREERRPYHITFVPDPICWTEAPTDLKSLKSQRMRWQRGLAESLSSNIGLMFDYRGGAVSWLAFPFMVFFEMIGPAIEVLGYTAMIGLFVLDLIPRELIPLNLLPVAFMPMQSFMIFMFASVGLGVLLSTNAMFLEELSFQMYPRSSQQLKLFAAAVLENFGYRQINSIWRFMGLCNWLFSARKRHRWGDIARDGSWQQPGEHHEATDAAHQPLPTPPKPQSTG